MGTRSTIDYDKEGTMTAPKGLIARLKEACTHLAFEDAKREHIVRKELQQLFPRYLMLQSSVALTREERSELKIIIKRLTAHYPFHCPDCNRARIEKLEKRYPQLKQSGTPATV